MTTSAIRIRKFKKSENWSDEKLWMILKQVTKSVTRRRCSIVIEFVWIDSFDMVQNITGSTHKGGHTLDLVITRRNSPPTNYRGDPPVYSDHSLVLCAFPPMNFVVHHKTKNVRFWKHLNRDSFRKSLLGSQLCGQRRNYTWAMPRLPFGLPRLPCPQIDKTFYVTLMLFVSCPGCLCTLVTPLYVAAPKRFRRCCLPLSSIYTTEPCIADEHLQVEEFLYSIRSSTYTVVWLQSFKTKSQDVWKTI